MAPVKRAVQGEIPSPAAGVRKRSIREKFRAECVLKKQHKREGFRAQGNRILRRERFREPSAAIRERCRTGRNPEPAAGAAATARARERASAIGTRSGRDAGQGEIPSPPPALPPRCSTRVGQHLRHAIRERCRAGRNPEPAAGAAATLQHASWPAPSARDQGEMPDREKFRALTGAAATLQHASGPAPSARDQGEMPDREKSRALTGAAATLQHASGPAPSARDQGEMPDREKSRARRRRGRHAAARELASTIGTQSGRGRL